MPKAFSIYRHSLKSILRFGYVTLCLFGLAFSKCEGGSYIPITVCDLGIKKDIQSISSGARLNVDPDEGKKRSDPKTILSDSNTGIVITCPPDITVECDQSLLPAVTGSALVMDDCGDPPTMQYHDYATTPPASGSEMRWIYLPPGTVTGSCTSGTSCETGTICFGLQYTPDASGILTSYTTGFFINCINGNNPVVSNMSCVMVDNSGELTDCAGSGLILMNNSGNTGSINVVRRVPVILHQICLQLGTDGVINFDEDENTDLTTSINIPGSYSITELPEFVNYVAIPDLICNPGCPYPLDVFREFSATDSCDNYSSCIQKITIVDHTAPVIICPPDTMIMCNSITLPTATGVATSVDNCDPDPVMVYTDLFSPGSCPQSGLITRTWISTDRCGNTNSSVQLISIQDTIRPVLQCPGDTILDCTSLSSPLQTGSATAIDICDGSPQISFSDATVPGECLTNYNISRRWIAEDACLNRDTCYQTITVQDTTSPSITCPADVTILYPAGTLPVNTGAATSTDLCDGAPVMSYQDSFPGQYCPQTNFINRTWYATDACGNQSSCSQRITIEDKGTICGTVHDDFGFPLPGVTIQLQADMNGNQVVDAGDTMVATTTTSAGNGMYCFTDIRPCNYVVVEVQPATYGSLSDFDSSPDPDGDDSADGFDNQIPVTLSPIENDVDNDFIDIVCPTVVPTLPMDTICSGQSVVLQMNDLNLGSLSYSWNFGSGSFPGTGMGLGPHTVSYVTTTQNQMGGASVVVTISKMGCPDLAGQVTLIDVNPYPNAAINASTSSICYFTNKTFQPVAPPIPGATYNWNFGSGAVPATASGYGPQNVYYTSAGTKTVKLVIHPNEAGAQCPDSSTVSFTVLSCPAQVVGNVLSNALVGIGNVTLKLFEDNNADGMADNTTAIRTVTTSTTPPFIGLYVMASLTPGSYVIVETQPSGWLNYDDYDASNDGDLVTNISGTDNLIPVTLLPSEVDSMNNFIESAQPGSITGNVFDDENGNMSPDNGEGLSNVSLRLLNDNNADGKADNNTPVATVVTNPTGNYIFNSIPSGNYVLVETNPGNYLSVEDFDPTNDGDIVANTNMNNDTIPLTLTSNETDANNYFLDIIACPLMVINTLDDGYGSLRYNVDCAESGDTILFHSSLAGMTIQISSAAIELDKNLVFISTLTPRVTIASSTLGLFGISDNVTVEFKDLNVTGGNGTVNIGAAFENEGTLKLHNILVQRNILFPLVEYLLRNEDGSSIFISGSCSFEN